MRTHPWFLPALALIGLLGTGSAAALTLEPPVPPDCQAADHAQNLQVKVNLYTSCLDRPDPGGPKLRDWQRNRVHLRRADAWFEMGRFAEAIADYDRYLSGSGLSVWALHRRGVAYGAIGEPRLGLADLDAALRINPDALDARHDRGRMRAAQGQYPGAVADLRHAATKAPREPVYANTLAWLLATCPDPRYHDGQAAVRLAEQAIMQDRQAAYLDTLAAAHARAGNFERAVAAQQEAMNALGSGGESSVTIKEFEARLGQYAKGKPYTEGQTP